MKFSEVSSCFEKIEAESGRLVMTRLLAELLGKVSPQQAAIICTMSLGQLHPPYIGTQFNLAEKNVIKVIAHLLKQSQEETAKIAKEKGDLGLVIQEGNWQQADDLTVDQVYENLVALERMGGTGSQEIKQEVLLELLRALDPISAKYVVRIVIGKLRLGFSDMTLVDALSWMQVGDKSLRPIIESAYNVRADIGLIAKELKEHGTQQLEQMKITVGIPIRPASAERLPTAKDIVEKLGKCVAQPKLDGFRLQIHLDKTESVAKINFYSRHLQDMSYMFPDVHDAVASLPVKTMIFEGEAIVFDHNTNSFLPFQETVKRKRKHHIKEKMLELPLRVFIFDLLYLDGQSYLDKAHAERRSTLEHLFKKVKGHDVSLIEEVEINTTPELNDYFTHHISAGLEGLVVKRPDATYRAGKRNFNWIKLKRQEEGQLGDTLDCVILGYYPGAGRRAAFGIGAFLVGVYNQKEDCFETVAKVGTGLKDVDWKELKTKCDLIAVQDKPKNVVCPKELYPDVWTSPEIVCLIRADEITLSPLHTAGKAKEKHGYALRFPRFMGYRTDKTADHATTPEEIITLYKNQFKK